MKTIFLTLIIIVLFSTNNSFGQKSMNDVVKNKDGVFKGSINNTSGYPDNYIGSYNINFAIWTLMGEPMNNYNFSWTFDENKTHWFMSHRFSIRDLKKHPDLYQRFMKIRPLPDIKVIGFPLSFYNGDEYIGYAKIDISIDLPAYSGDKENFSVSSSPSWSRFFNNPSTKYRGDPMWYAEYRQPNVVNENMIPQRVRELGNTAIDNYILMNYSNTIKEGMSFLYTIEAKWPIFQIEEIFKEYLCRENKLSKEECGEKEEEKETKIAEEQKDDFWDLNSKETDEIASADKPKSNTTNDDFWGLPDNNTKPSETSSQKKSQDFWDFKDEKKDNSDPFWSLDNNDDSFWSNFDNSSADIYIIEKDPGRSNKFGVKNKLTGNITIPYDYEHIFFVKDGIAKVAKLKNKTSDNQGCDRTIEFSFYDIYFINMDNKRISDIKNGLNIATSIPMRIVLESAPYGETAAEKERRERAREQQKQRERDRERECMNHQNDYINQYKQNFVRNGGELLDLK